jgi:hypothetical protein
MAHRKSAPRPLPPRGADDIARFVCRSCRGDRPVENGDLATRPASGTREAHHRISGGDSTSADRPRYSCLRLGHHQVTPAHAQFEQAALKALRPDRAPRVIARTSGFTPSLEARLTKGLETWEDGAARRQLGKASLVPDGARVVFIRSHSQDQCVAQVTRLAAGCQLHRLLAGPRNKRRQHEAGPFGRRCASE